jgi:hypothetical protein
MTQLSVSQLVIRYLGKTGSWAGIKDLSIDVIVDDVRQVFGSTQFRVTPLSGIGAKWVHADTVSFPDIDAGELL